MNYESVNCFSRRAVFFGACVFPPRRVLCEQNKAWSNYEESFKSQQRGGSSFQSLKLFDTKANPKLGIMEDRPNLMVPARKLVPIAQDVGRCGLNADGIYRDLKMLGVHPR